MKKVKSMKGWAICKNMPFNFYETHTLLMAVERLTPANSFLRDRYFPTNAASDVFATDDVLVEYKDGSKNGAKMAAWVPTATLYVRKIESGGKILLVSTEKTKAVYTGRVNASDVHKI